MNNNILIDILNSKSAEYKQRFLQMTDIELNECKPELFNNHRYIDKLYKHDVFIFCSNNGDIIALSKGRDQKQFGYQNLIIYQQTPLTFNTLLNESPIIIRVPVRYLTYHPRYNKKWNREIVSVPLKKRLIIYKEHKRNNTVTNVIKNIIISITNHLYDEKIPKELLKVLDIQDKRDANMQTILDRAMNNIRILNNNYIMVPKGKMTYINDFHYKDKLFNLEKVLKKINWYIEI